MSYMTYDLLYQSQDTLLQQIFAAESTLLPGSTLILAGGTALARCHLAFEAKRHFDQALVRLSDPHENVR
jgi:predicted nucleotidyltransferase component of viral defense system